MPLFKTLAEIWKQAKQNNKNLKEMTAAQEKEQAEGNRLYRKALPLVERSKQMRVARSKVHGRVQAVEVAQTDFLRRELTDRSIADFEATLNKIDKDFPV